MSSRVRRLSCRLLALVLALQAVPTGPARACVNATLGEDMSKALASAESSLEEGEPAYAAWGVLELFPTLMDGRPPRAHAALFERSRRVLAVALVRSGAMFLRTEIARGPALTWATQVLRARREGQPDDPERVADLAEALAQRPTCRAEAFALLDGLARADLMPEPRGWAVLGELARSLGQPEVGRSATRRCFETARGGWVCNVRPLA